MKKILYAIMLAAAGMGVTSCLGNGGVEDQYKEWREANEKWFVDQSMKVDDKGQLYYEDVVPAWDPSAHVLIHWFNDREATKDNLSPLYSSTVDVKYIGRVYTGEAFDSSFVSKSPADSIARFSLNGNGSTSSGVIEGWCIAIPRMHVGDSCRVVINHPQAYGSSMVNATIKPYSVLQFDIKLVDIHKYETK